MSPDEPDPERRYAAVVTAVDGAIGRVFGALNQAGVENETFVFFMSDNGAFRLGREGLDVGSNAPLRHGGVTCWEGGLRVAAMARWPARIRAGCVVSQPCWSPDLLIACAKLAEAKLPEAIVFDGLDPLPLFIENARSPHDTLFFMYGTHAALRKGDWKIVREFPGQPWMLFNLLEDTVESRNLAHDHPERVIELEDAFRLWLSRLN